MTDIFISYSQNDRDRVKRLVDALSAEGYDVWWDLNIRAGESFDKRIEGMLEKVSCVVGVWSNTSVNSEWVRAESGWAKDRDIFVSARIDNEARLPLKFYYVHAANLTGWNGSRDSAEFRSVLKDVEVLTGPPTPATRPLSRLGNPANTDIASPARPFEALSNFRDPLRDGAKGPEMVVIPAGTFWMGSDLDDGGGDSSERPFHQVEIPTPFALGKTPVTFSDYDRFAKATSRRKPQSHRIWRRGIHPVTDVSWHDAVAYVSWLSEQTGKHYRLPSEAEWEYACRAGTQTQWSCGSEEPNLVKYAWYEVNSNHNTHPVGKKRPNRWGLQDMHGNVYEWVRDCWHNDYDGAPTDRSAWGEDYGRRVVRGGSFFNNATHVRSAYRFGFRATDGHDIVGFRLARDH